MKRFSGNGASKSWRKEYKMAEYDLTFIRQLLDMTSEERVAYMNSLPPEERKSLERAAFHELANQATAELINRMKLNDRADQLREQGLSEEEVLKKLQEYQDGEIAKYKKQQQKEIEEDQKKQRANKG
jgi:L-lysine 2,3-aminomutase